MRTSSCGTVANAFRRFDVDSGLQKPWPWLYGMVMNILPAPTPRQHAAPSDLQIASWMQGKKDLSPTSILLCTVPNSIDDVPLATEASYSRAQHWNLSGRCLPSRCEMTGPACASSMYMAIVSIAHAPAGWVALDPGRFCGRQRNYSLAGRLGAAGGRSHAMDGCPWQTDTASCRNGYDRPRPVCADVLAPRAPNEVLTEEGYQIVVTPRARSTVRPSPHAPVGSRLSGGPATLIRSTT